MTNTDVTDLGMRDHAHACKVTGDDGSDIAVTETAWLHHALQAQTRTPLEIISLYRVAADDLSACDLRSISSDHDDSEAYRADLAGQAQAVEALVVPSAGRIGVAWGADASWAEVRPGEAVGEAILRVLAEGSD